MLRRWSGGKIIVGSLALAAAGVLPLVLYAVFGPSDGNPVGLGLLAVAVMPFAAVGVLIGAVKLAVQYFSSGK
jgi:hypothetical protein